jgi:phosphoserine phosphatase RsbU/P
VKRQDLEPRRPSPPQPLCRPSPPARLRRFVSDFAGGVRTKDVQRLFRRDASRALEVLLRDQGTGAPPSKGLMGLLQRLKLLFFGLSYKLTPPRRMLFVASLSMAVLGLADISVSIVPGAISVDSSPGWFMLSIGALLFLLALELVDRVRVRDELEVARQLQRDLLPSGEVLVPGLTIAHAYRTANEVGGDFYDFLPVPDGRLALIIGDASGHGMAAGLLMATAKATLGLAMDLDPDPVAVMTALNRRLHATGDRRSFLTLFYGLLDPVTGELEFISAGHPFPLLRREGGTVEEIGAGSLPLGVRPDFGSEAKRARLDPGDLLFLYTDGLPEALDEASGEAFGFHPLQDLLAVKEEPEAVVDKVLRALAAHLAGEPPQDDVSLAVVARKPVDRTGEAS